MTKAATPVPYRHNSGFIGTPALYYERFEPVQRNSRSPLLMMTGGAHTGASYLITPDGRPGWAHDFLEAGYEVILVDWPGVGRSGYVPPHELGGRLVVDGIATLLKQLERPVTLLSHSISGTFGWKLLEENPDHIERLIAIAPAPPANMGHELGRLVRADGQKRVVAMPSGEIMIDLAAMLSLDMAFARAKLVGSSTRFPMAAFDAYHASLSALSGRIVFERTNIGGVQLQIENPSALGNKPILVVTGTDDIDHPVELDGAVVDWLRRAGAKADLLDLGSVGVDGNGHMMMPETNSRQIAHLIIGWLEQREIIAA